MNVLDNLHYVINFALSIIVYLWNFILNNFILSIFLSIWLFYKIVKLILVKPYKADDN